MDKELAKVSPTQNTVKAQLKNMDQEIKNYEKQFRAMQWLLNNE